MVGRLERMDRFSEDPPAYFARTLFRDQSQAFGIKQDDRFSHMYLIGKTGTGKSTALKTMVLQDLAAGRGLCVIDPHGDLVEHLVDLVPEHRRDQLRYFDPADSNQPYGYNPLKWVSPERRPLAASGMLDTFKHLWPDAWGQRMEHVLRHALLALLDIRDSTLADVLRIFVDDEFRRTVAARTQNPQAQLFWREEFPKYSRGYRAEAIAPVQNKIGAFLADPRMFRILTKPEQLLSPRAIMDEGGILLVNLSKGRLGSDSADMLGGLLVTTIALAAFSRADMAEQDRRPFFLYVDEFQSFTTLTLATMASELRKYRIGLVLAHQYLNQLEPEIRHAVLGNTGTMIAFRVGAEDAPLLALEFMPRFGIEDLLNLPNYHIYLKLMINGTPSRPFSAVTLSPDELGS